MSAKLALEEAAEARQLRTLLRSAAMALLGLVIGAAALLGTSLIVAANLPARPAVEVALIPVGALAVFFGSSANAHMQILSAPHLRGRVMSIYTLLTLGSTVVGGPFVGWVCQRWTPRTGLALAGFATASAALALLVRSAARARAPEPAAGIAR